MEKKNKYLLISFLAVYFLSCNDNTVITEVKTEHKNDIDTSIIAYQFGNELTQFIEDSITNPAFCKEVDYCIISQYSNNYEITFRYVDTDINAEREFIKRHTNRFIQLNKQRIPILLFSDFFYNDFAFIDKSKNKRYSANWFEYAKLTITPSQEIVKFKNYLLCFHH